MAFDKLVLQVTEMSSRWLQSSTPRSRRGQSNSEFSVPSHSTSSSHICPVPAPNVLPMGSPDRLNKTKYRNAVHYHMRSETYIVLYSVLDYQFRSFEYDKLKLLIIVAVWSCFTGRVYVLGYREVLLRCPRCVVWLSVEAKLWVGAHVFFSYEERMKVVKTFIRERVMLPIGAAFCRM